MPVGARGTEQLRIRLRDWLSLERPVTYWSLWAALLETIPVAAAIVVAAALLLRDPLAIASLSPVPYVFFAATLGFAIRRLNRRYVLLSLLLVIGYTSLLGLLGLFSLLFAGNVATFAVVISLTFLSLLIGFAWPSLHRDGDAVDSPVDRPGRLRETIEGRKPRTERTPVRSPPGHGDVGWGDVPAREPVDAARTDAAAGAGSGR